MIFPLILFLVSALAKDPSFTLNNESFMNKISESKNTVRVNEKNSTLNKLKKRSGARSIDFLTPGQEFLLSIAGYEDAKVSSWDSVPYLMNVLQTGKLEVKHNRISEKNDKHLESDFPMSMMQMMKMMTAMDKADKHNNGDSDEEVSVFSGFLQSLAQDPKNILLAAIIPFSLLLAAVIPLLVNQMSSGSFLNTITTTASGGKAYEQRQFLENVVPTLDGIASFGSKMSEEMTKQTTDKKKLNVLKNILNYISSFITEKWIQKLISTPVQRQRSSCSGINCSAKS